MARSRTWRTIVLSDTGILVLLALLRFVPLLLTNGEIGWHRDELDTLDNAHYLDWGYTAYPPFAPFIARAALTFFGASLVGVRMFSNLAQAIVLVLAGLMARELGGRRWAQAAAAVAVGIAPFPLLGGTLFSYSSFDGLWWVLIAYLLVRLLKSGDPRWWLAIGATIGAGMMTKYTIAFLVAGLIVGVIITRARRFLLSPWLWGGVVLALLIVLPNLIWQIQHGWISLDFTRSIHARDVRDGRAEGYLIEQLVFAANAVTIPLWVLGLWFYLFAGTGRNYRLLGWLYVVPLVLFLVLQGRSYYIAPAYPMLLAGGAVVVERWLASLPAARARLVQGVTWVAFAVSGTAFALIASPITPINSPVWEVASEINGELSEMVGWPELVDTVAGIYAALPTEDKAQAGILTGNYGEAGALNLYGPAYGLPKAISGVNSYWMRGSGDPPPQTVIVVGMNFREAQALFESCRTAGVITNRYNVSNEETREHSIVLLCGGPRIAWPELWKRMLKFG